MVSITIFNLKALNDLQFQLMIAVATQELSIPPKGIVIISSSGQNLVFGTKYEGMLPHYLLFRCNMSFPHIEIDSLISNPFKHA